MDERPTARTFTYRIPLDDTRAMSKIRRLQKLDAGYHIAKITKSRVPNGKAVRNWGAVFYESRESYDYDRREMVGGTIPGLGNYRYSLEWEPTPETELLEMRHANGGGTKIRGEQFVGTHDPRLPDYVPVDTVVPWTVGEIKDMFDGEPVPDRRDYTRDPPEIPAKEARRQFNREIDFAIDAGLETVREKLREAMENCGHSHVVETPRGSSDEAAVCEDCGKVWDRFEYQAVADTDEITVVGEI